MLVPLPNSRNLSINANFTGNNTSSIANDEDPMAASDPIDHEKDWHEEKAHKRNEIFKSIILNEYNDFSLTDAAVPFGIVAFAFALTTPNTLIPYHDLFQNPEYWYELIVPGCLAGAMCAAHHTILGGHFLNIDYLLLPRIVTLMFSVGSIYMLFLLLITYNLWTQVLNYRYPIPFLGLFSAYSCDFFSIMVFCIIISRNMRQHNNLKGRMFFRILLLVLRLIFVVCILVIVEEMKKYSDSYQALVALTLPAAREMYLWISEIMLEKMSNGDSNSSKTVFRYLAYSLYTIQLCIVIGSNTTEITSMLLIGIDYAYNI